MLNNKNYYKKGIAPLIVLVVILFAAIIGYIAYIMFFSIDDPGEYFQENMMYEEETSSPPPAEEPVSDSNDLDTIEAELDATITGSALDDIEQMETEASSL